MNIQNKMKKKVNSLNNQREKVLTKFQSIKDTLDGIDTQINYFNELINVKPQILFNQGRERKYVYGQIYFYLNQTSNKKKSYRFIIGKMYEDKSRKEWEDICLDKFYEKVEEDI